MVYPTRGRVQDARLLALEMVNAAMKRMAYASGGQHLEASTPLPFHEGQLELRDGRMLGWAEFGVPHGSPVLYFHGTLSSRLEAADLVVTALRLELRIIAVDRPGVGRSTSIRRPSPAGFADDIKELVDSLGLARFGLLGLSAGGGYAACVASRMPTQVESLVLCSSLCPPGPGLQGSKTLQRMAALAKITILHLWFFAKLLSWLIRRKGVSLIRENARTPWERRANELPNHPEVVTQAWLEGTRQGAIPVARDAAAILRPWNVDLRPLPCRVEIWHGLGDETVPATAAHFYASVFPHASLHLIDDEGHTLLVSRQAEVLATFAARG